MIYLCCYIQLTLNFLCAFYTIRILNVEPERGEEGVGADETQGRQALGPGGRPSEPKLGIPSFGFGNSFPPVPLSMTGSSQDLDPVLIRMLITVDHLAHVQPGEI